PKAVPRTMQLTSTVLTLSSLLSLSLAAPQAAPSTTAVPTSSEYYLKSQVINEGSSSKDGLYISPYHTGAGFNDATLGPLDEGCAKGFLNGTYQQFDLASGDPWAFIIGADTNYAGTNLRSQWHKMKRIRSCRYERMC
ncbi:hypothetical protein MMC08_007359, partial [Hypocenomyce scalaris]|nr:hypothetical protein [Hypocenomyce scalaris]